MSPQALQTPREDPEKEELRRLLEEQRIDSQIRVTSLERALSDKEAQMDTILAENQDLEVAVTKLRHYLEQA